MSLPAIELKKAIRNRLVSDTTLTTLLGGARIYDETPRAAAPPYVVFGELISRDVSTVSGRAHESVIVLQALSNESGHKQAHAIAARLEELLHDAPLTIAGHVLVNLMLTGSEARRERNNEATRATLRFRAYTEKL
jgi:hypothetical protein